MSVNRIVNADDPAVAESLPSGPEQSPSGQALAALLEIEHFGFKEFKNLWIEIIGLIGTDAARRHDQGVVEVWAAAAAHGINPAPVPGTGRRHVRAAASTSEWHKSVRPRPAAHPDNSDETLAALLG